MQLTGQNYIGTKASGQGARTFHAGHTTTNVQPAPPVHADARQGASRRVWQQSLRKAALFVLLPLRITSYSLMDPSEAEMMTLP